VKFHKPIDTSALDRAGEDALSDTLHAVIQDGVRELQKLSPRG